MSDRRATLHDVARHCSVSYQTVSRVVNNHPYVAPETRERVLRAIDELGYRPNRAAQSLAANQSHVLGMLTFGIENYGPAQVMIHTEQAARAAGYDLIFVHTPDSRVESLRAALNRLLHWQVDGLILITPLTNISLDDVRSLSGDYPMVQIGLERGASVPSVGVNQHRGGELVADYLLSLGHEEIAELAGPDDWFDAAERHHGFVTRLGKANTAPVATVHGDWSSRSGYQAIKTLIAAGTHFTALFCANDQMAIGALQALSEAGRRVPEDVSVIGFDDIPEAAYLIPPLTTVRQDFAAVGQQGIAGLLQRIAEPDGEPQQTHIEPTLIERQSTAPRK
ncbi:MAG: LacI family DNA-binding transcriptional regulator [Anaerolineae bacterium]|nr:LacI family DNA-binding transcriptional regulator [Anaerolineae bacterium]